MQLHFKVLYIEAYLKQFLSYVYISNCPEALYNTEKGKKTYYVLAGLFFSGSDKGRREAMIAFGKGRMAQSTREPWALIGTERGMSMFFLLLYQLG